MRVPMTPMLLLHIVMGTLGCLTGYAALLCEKAAAGTRESGPFSRLP